MNEARVVCNTNGASRGNLGPSAYRYCIRSIEDNLIHVEIEYLG